MIQYDRYYIQQEVDKLEGRVVKEDVEITNAVESLTFLFRLFFFSMLTVVILLSVLK